MSKCKAVTYFGKGDPHPCSQPRAKGSDVCCYYHQKMREGLIDPMQDMRMSNVTEVLVHKTVIWPRREDE